MEYINEPNKTLQNGKTSGIISLVAGILGLIIQILMTIVTTVIGGGISFLILLMLIPSLVEGSNVFSALKDYIVDQEEFIFVGIMILGAEFLSLALSITAVILGIKSKKKGYKNENIGGIVLGFIGIFMEIMFFTIAGTFMVGLLMV